MATYDVLARACPTRQVVNRIGDRWSLLVIYALEDRKIRFQELLRTVEGVSQKMLTHTLRGLERDGIVRREVWPTVPPKVEYSLTPLGLGLAIQIAGIRDWAYGHMDDISAARERFDLDGAVQGAGPDPGEGADQGGAVVERRTAGRGQIVEPLAQPGQ
jgi:DNA-binding HxlR family transcriptional regulator